MAYVYSFINRLEQFGTVNYELVADDDEGLLPPIRQWIKLAADTKPARIALGDKIVQATAQARAEEATAKQLQITLDADVEIIVAKDKAVKAQADLDTLIKLKSVVA